MSASSNKKATLDIDGKTIELPIVAGTENEKAIDITKLRSQTGHVTLDNGYMNTGACLSGITFLDGEKGILKYRGIPIEELAEKSNFLEVSSLLINGNVPSSQELKHFSETIKAAGRLPKGILDLLKHYPKNAHPMGVLSSLTVGLSAFYPDLMGPQYNESEKKKAIAILMGQLKVLAANYYRHSKGLRPLESNPDQDYCSDFINLMFSQEGENVCNSDVAKALDVLFILHADHEQNCSTSTVRMVGSSQANLFATISAGIDALWGPLHGGANQAVIEMLDAIKADGGGHKKFLNKAKDKDDTFRLMGFGHRVYKNFDPRARIIKKACDTVLEKLGVNDPVLEIAKGLEEEALKDPYFVERKLYPNVDFYSGIIYRAIGIPTDMFTVMFALGRLPGWLAQWNEMTNDPSNKICRPRQIYTGEVEKRFKK